MEWSGLEWSAVRLAPVKWGMRRVNHMTRALAVRDTSLPRPRGGGVHWLTRAPGNYLFPSPSRLLHQSKAVFVCQTIAAESIHLFSRSWK